MPNFCHQQDVKEPVITAACIKVLRTIMYGLKSAIVPHSSDLLKVSLDFLERESEMVLDLFNLLILLFSP